MINEYVYNFDKTELPTNSTQLDLLTKQYEAVSRALKNEGLSDQGKASKATLEDVISLLVANKITKEAAVSELSKISGKSTEEVDAVLNSRGL